MRYPTESFTAEERARLAPHVTDLDGPVFALVNLPETVKGALFARYSRYQGTLRRLYLEEFAVANVHLSHGQVLNRRQLRVIAQVLPPRAAVLGDYNLLGPALLPGFRVEGFWPAVLGSIVVSLVSWAAARIFTGP